MAYCSKCGRELIEAAAFCGSCGTSITFGEAKPLRGIASSKAPTQDIPENWRETFTLIEKAGGPKAFNNVGVFLFGSLAIRELPFSERTKVAFNGWGFLFGPFYYLAKGMWKKAITLTGLSIAIVLILSMVLTAMGFSDKITLFVGAAIFGSRTNIDYYKKVVLGDDSWW